MQTTSRGFPMEKGKTIEAANGEILLPEAIIQYIQSFLTGKQAAQTTILSRSWYRAWLTRPNLDFDRDHFRGTTVEFGEFAKKTMQRYEESNLKIESFRLCMSRHSVAKELIVKAMKIGATDLSFKFGIGGQALALPHEVLGSESLIKLSVDGCEIDLGADGKVRCSRLKSLSLGCLHLEGGIIWDIISSCPLIEELSLFGCVFLFEPPSSNDTGLLALNPFVKFGKQNVGSVVDGPINLYVFHKLKCLSLSRIDIHTLFFGHFSSKFPCLKDLTLDRCGGCDHKGIQISSHSLECISFTHNRMFSAKFDVPRIRKFRFAESNVPALSFRTASREWESNIYMGWEHPSISWFLGLEECLTNLSLSKISLTLFGFSGGKDVDFQVLPKTVVKTAVENLTVYAPSSGCCALLECLFWCCHPKFITQYWFPESRFMGGKEHNNFLEILCKRLVQGVGENYSIPNQNTLCLHDLEEVNVEVFEEGLAEWRPLPWKTLLDPSKYPKEDKQKIRFHLRWGLEPSPSK